MIQPLFTTIKIVSPFLLIFSNSRVVNQQSLYLIMIVQSVVSSWVVPRYLCRSIYRIHCYGIISIWTYSIKRDSLQGSCIGSSRSDWLASLMPIVLSLTTYSNRRQKKPNNNNKRNNNNNKNRKNKNNQQKVEEYQ